MASFTAHRQPRGDATSLGQCCLRALYKRWLVTGEATEDRAKAGSDCTDLCRFRVAVGTLGTEDRGKADSACTDQAAPGSRYPPPEEHRRAQCSADEIALRASHCELRFVTESPRFAQYRPGDVPAPVSVTR